MSEVVIKVEELKKTFYVGFFRTKIEAVKEVSFEVNRGEIFGFLGPNGAGKTTTIKVLMGLIRPTAGRAFILGKQVPAKEIRNALGFLPENPCFYEHLKARELLYFYAHLHDIPRTKRKKRMEEILAQVGLSDFANLPIRKFSRGMVQRLGIAQALLHDPELIVLDEPLAGLDPIGRKEIRDIILELKSRGKTIFFSSHILSDVEMLCDRVAIINKGRLIKVSSLDKLLKKETRYIDIEIQGEIKKEDLEKFRHLSKKLSFQKGKLGLMIEGEEKIPLVINQALSRGYKIGTIIPCRETLEDLFIREAFS
jgi:ABC-2 type transport system ATP-binding protein